MNKKFTKALLGATVLTTGIVGASSIMAQASDDGVDTATTVTVIETDAEQGLQAPAQVDTDVDSDATDTEGEEHEGRGCGGGEAVAEALGITTDELQAARADGSTIADVAAAQGVDVDVVIQAIVDAKAERLDAKVAEGELTEAEAQERLAAAQERATAKVNGEAGDEANGLRRGNRPGPDADVVEEG